MDRKPSPDGQTELFPDALLPGEAKTAPGGNAEAPRDPPRQDPDLRAEAVALLLETASPVRPGSRAAAWLKAQRIFRKTWDAQGLRVVDNYAQTAETLLARFSAHRLQAWGLFNKDGHLRFYVHSLLVPWFDGGKPVWLQAQAPDPEVKPARLSLSAPPPCPYNARLLDGKPGRLYLCSGVTDTLELLEAGFPAVGLPENGEPEPAWLPRFREKSVYVAFDADTRGEAAAAKILALLSGAGVDAHRLQVPAGKNVGAWMAGK